MKAKQNIEKWTWKGVASLWLERPQVIIKCRFGFIGRIIVNLFIKRVAVIDESKKTKEKT